MAAETEGKANDDAAETKTAPRRMLSHAAVLRESLKYSAPGCAEMPDDIDVFRVAFSRQIRTLLGDARRCREPVCRRAKRCAGVDMRCQREQPAPPTTPEQWARVRAEFYKALEREVGRQDAE